MAKQVREYSPHGRRLRVEHLEDRRLLAVLTVQNDLDDTLANLAGDGELSLREAIEIANNPGTTIDGFVSNDVDDTIEFARPFFDQPRTIFLQDGELEITETLTIDGPGQELLTIDAQQQSRIFNIDHPDILVDRFDVTITDAMLTNGRSTGPSVVGGNTQSGGAIRSVSFGQLTIERSTISGNSTAGVYGDGGGVFAYELILRDSLVIANSTQARTASGGGIDAGVSATISNSVITNNHALGTQGQGGGVRTASLNMIGSSVTDNSSGGRGGGIATGSDTEIRESTISGNRSDSRGGGISAFGDFTLRSSTVSGNQAVNTSPIGGSTRGGGVLTYGDTQIIRTTVTDNHAVGRNAEGGGIWMSSQGSLSVFGAVIAGNTSYDEGPDIRRFYSPLLLSHSLIGDTIDSGILATSGPSNLLNVDPRLGPLADNGGPTQTHALLPGSPALDAGNPAIGFDPGEFDQRGAPFSRVATGILSGVPQQRIDIGAYEAQSPPSADFVDDDHLNGQDFLAWQLGLGLTESATRAEGDSDGDGDVDLSDLAAWRVSYGQTEAPPPPPLVASGQGPVDSEVLAASLVDAVLGLVGDDDDESEAVIVEQLMVGVASDAKEGNVLPAGAAESGATVSLSEPTDDEDSFVVEVGEYVLDLGL